MLTGVEKEVYSELCNKEHWDLSYDRMSFKLENDKGLKLDLGLMYEIKETDAYKDISRQLVEGTYPWSVPRKVELAKAGTTKKRIVYIYSDKDRFILGVLYRALSNLFMDKLSPNCFSYKRGVNTSSAIHYIHERKKNTKMYGLKLDIQSYFNSVSRNHLNQCLTELFGESSGIRKTMDKLFNDDTVLYRNKEIQEYKSLIAGSALGSFFANYCLREIDFHFTDKEIIYARYSDDIILLDKSMENINKHVEYIKERLKEYGLSVNEKKYEKFNPEDEVEYLGLSLSNRGIDIGNHAKKKLKKTIKRWVKAGRKEIEMRGTPFEIVAERLVNRLNWKLYKSYIEDERRFGWAYYAFRYITVLDSLTEIDFYLRDRLRYMKTGKNNKANVKALNDPEFRDLGVLSLFDMYKLFKEDFDYYCEVASLI